MVNWVLTGVVGILLAFVVFYLKETFLTIKKLGEKMDKAFVIMQKNSDHIKFLGNTQAVHSSSIEKLEDQTARNTKDIAVIHEKIKI